MTTSTLIVISFIVLLLYILVYRKLKIITFRNIIYWLLFSLISGVLWGVTIGKVIVDESPKGFTSETTCKEYILDNFDDVYLVLVDFPYENVDTYRMDTCTLNYWCDVTISNYVDSIGVIFWGDRESWFWDYRSDKSFIIYRTSANVDSVNVMIFEMFDKIEIK